jgi:predicted RNA-binding Zn ribbon-like protein
MIDRSFSWLVFPPAVDLANTVVITANGPVDLLSTDEELEAWVAVESARVPDARSALGRLAEVRVLRDAVHELLHAHPLQVTPPPSAVAAVNEASAASPVARSLGAGLELHDRELGRTPWDRFRGAVGRSAVELAASQTVAECGAPSCGMLFLPANARQTWCSPACGNRARVARHLRRRRGATSATEVDAATPPTGTR